MCVWGGWWWRKVLTHEELVLTVKHTMKVIGGLVVEEGSYPRGACTHCEAHNESYRENKCT
jgi:hypothetical protein